MAKRTTRAAAAAAFSASTFDSFPTSSEKHQSRNPDFVAADEPGWNCSVCTFRNDPEIFVCGMCDVRRGTSTRKPRISANVAAQQEHAQKLIQQQQAELLIASSHRKKVTSKRANTDPGPALSPMSEPGPSPSTSKTPTPSPRSFTPAPKKHKKAEHLPRLTNVDRQSARTLAVTVNGFTVVITDYKPKTSKKIELDEEKVPEEEKEHSVAVSPGHVNDNNKNNNNINNHHDSSPPPKLENELDFQV